ncbi:hypothetical protein BST81_16435 [Leptolyngbya sp. 'hensonii']|uniref:hypothetical protein n=1 Tax=Leptolyngbya sp. 'hensonii' TaxID=1922337 RepID=UPI0009501320|nr:hypothetical protein [Leptolyngbya sp. 'hensonii']OLP17386.1 hypothetical protein BST81_16435 [Leptolyngbya sp. 'hensonii']
MSHSSLPADDQPSHSSTEDRLLRRQLEESIGKRFYETCDGVIQGLLTRCEWYVTTSAQSLTLVIACPDHGLNWQILNNITAIAAGLEAFSDSARIRICPPAGLGAPYEMRIDEVFLYQDPH